MEGICEIFEHHQQLRSYAFVCQLTQVDLRARVVVPKSHERSHEFREGARHGDVVLRHAPSDLPERSTRLKDSTSAESRTTCEGARAARVSITRPASAFLLQPDNSLLVHAS